MVARMNDWLVAEYGAHLTEWEQIRARDAGFAYVALLCEMNGAALFPILDDPAGTEDEFGCRDGIDAMIFGSGEGTRADYTAGLWALERMGLAKCVAKTWTLTAAGRDAAVAIDAYAHLLKDAERKPVLTVIPGGEMKGSSHECPRSPI